MNTVLNKVDAAIIELLRERDKVFFASLLLQMNRIETTVDTPSMGVTIDNHGRILLLYNPTFVEKMKVNELGAIMEHECMHLAADHPMRVKDKNQVQFNVAADIAINQMITGLPKNALQPEHFGFPKDKYAEFYYELLNKKSYKITVTLQQCPNGAPQQCPKQSNGQGNEQSNEQSNGQCNGQSNGQSNGQGNEQSNEQSNGQSNGQGNEQCNGQGNGQCNEQCNGQSCPHKGTKDCPLEGGKYKIEIETPSGKKQVIDDHSKWKEFLKGNPTLNKEIIKQAIKEAYEETVKKRGYLPGNVESLVKEWLKAPSVPWQQLLRMYIGNNVKASSKFSWKRTSRRFGSDQKGKLPIRILKLAVAIDTSGSIGTKEFNEFISEIKYIQKCYKSDIDILECDAKVQKVYKLDPFKKLDTKFKGRGGTDYEPIFEYIKTKNMKPDLLVYFTDFYCTFPKKEPPYPVIWCVSSNGDKNVKPFWGVTVRIQNVESKEKD